MTLQDLKKIVDAKIAFQGKKFEKFTTLTDKYLALTGITQLAGGKTIEQLFEAADNKEKEIIAGKLAWCIPGGKGMGGIQEDDSKPQSEVDVETETYTAAEAAAHNAQLPGAKTTNDWKIEPVEAKPAIYSFKSFGTIGDTPTPYGTGTVKVISQTEDATKIEVLTNEPAGDTTPEDAAEFVGKQYFVHATELGAEKYTLYSEGGLETPIYVTVELVSEAEEAVEGVKYTQEEVDAYNATLDGAVKEGDTKPEQS